MSRIGFIALILWLWLLPVSSQSINLSSPSLGAGNAYLSTAAFNNIPILPSVFPKNKTLICYADYSNRYFLKELSVKRMAIGIPSGTTTFGIYAQSYGFKLYNENLLGLMLGKQLTENTHGGVRINYLQNHVAEKENSFAATWDASFSTSINKNLLLSGHLYNPLELNYKSNKDFYTPTIYNLSLGYTIKNHLVYEEIIHHSETDLELITGGVFNIHKTLGISSSFSNQSNLFALGVTIKMKSMTVQTGFQLHKKLGASSGMSLKYIL
ncbi:hypothetical protein OAO55_01565 [Bacteroidales bacterium]|nr:hypothetical protein [Bacteroidales bacterium]